MATDGDPAPTSDDLTAAARAVDAVKVYGTGDTAVRALDGVSRRRSRRRTSPRSWARRARASRR